MKKITGHHCSILKKATIGIVISVLFLTVLHVKLWAQSSAWQGDLSAFTITGNELQLNAPPVDGKVYLSKSSVAMEHASWEFLVRLNFNPSTANYARAYVTADQADLHAALNGYFIAIGEANDEVSLYRQTGTSRTKIIDGVDGLVNSATVLIKIRLTRKEGQWELFADVNNTGIYTFLGNALDNTHPSSLFTGFACTYTSTRSTGFYFQYLNVTGEAYIPPLPPAWKDVIINEIFADPAPRVSLPETEFIELFNRGQQAVNLGGWSISDGSSSAVLPAYVLSPESYVVIAGTNSISEFTGIKNIVGVTGFPSLNNTGDLVLLKFSDGTPIDSVRYTDAWYGGELKKEGGWSLELIDPQNTCAEETNWTVSENDNGGTPGLRNSVFANKPDQAPPRITAAIPQAYELVLHFDDKLSRDIPDLSDITVTPSIAIDRILFLDPTLRSLHIHTRDAFQPNTKYSLTIKNIYDCAGNKADNLSTTFVLPQAADHLDVLINEILFNPKAAGVDFVEVVNVSRKFINLKNWSLANLPGNTPVQLRTILNTDFILAPDEYRVFTSRKNVLLGEYPQAVADHVVELMNLPTMPDDEGTIVLLDSNHTTIDGLQYSKNHHSVFLKNDEGVSLERISFTHPTNDPANWTSASTASGFATPGFINSNASREQSLSDDAVQVIPEIFIPVTGQPAFTQIHYKFEKGGYIANAKILDASGRLIRQLTNNELLGTEGVFRWDGDQEDGTKARIGYYLVWLEVFSSDGIVQTFRKRVAIAARF
jgi:hypothetical protein